MKRLLLSLIVALIPTVGWGQATVLQGGTFTPGLVPTYSSSGGSQPVVQQSGPASGTGVGIKELSVIARGNACNTPQAPVVCAAQGSGQLGAIVQIQDAGATNAGGYHALSFSPNDGTGALIAYNAYGGASALPLRFNVNGTYYSFPFAVGGIVGPGTTVVNDAVCWNNTVGTLVKTCVGSTPLTIGGTNGQIQYNNAGALGGFTVSGDGTLNTGTGALTISSIGGDAVNLGGTLTTAAAFTQAGAFATTLTSTGATNVTLPTTGTLATLAGSEALTNKTVNGLTVTSTVGGTLTVANGKTLTASNTMILAGTDGSTLNISTGGTLGTAAFTAASAYVPSNTQITNSLGADVPMGATGTYYTGPSVAQGSTGTWFASGTVTIVNSVGGDVINLKLWDGSTVIASTSTMLVSVGGAYRSSVSLSGYLTSPAGNIRISVSPVSRTDGVIGFNASGNSKDSTITAFRVN